LGHGPVQGRHDNLKGILADLIDNFTGTDNNTGGNLGCLVSGYNCTLGNIIGGGKETTTGEKETESTNPGKKEKPFKSAAFLKDKNEDFFYNQNAKQFSNLPARLLLLKHQPVLKKSRSNRFDRLFST
jgi:hypothetical protein